MFPRTYKFTKQYIRPKIDIAEIVTILQGSAFDKGRVAVQYNKTTVAVEKCNIQFFNQFTCKD